MIHLHTLGDTLITVGDKEVRPSTPMVFAALLYLGVERGRRVPRAALRELFFPESDERSGSHSVRQLLYKLRQLGVLLQTDASTVCLPAHLVGHECDFSTSSTWGDAKLGAASRGFAPEYRPQISPRFSEWLEDQRSEVAARLRVRLLSALLQIRRDADWERLRVVAETLLSVDPLNEEATLALAEAAAATGAKHHALSLLSAYESETGSAIKVAPSLLRKRISDRLADPHFYPELELPLVGRARERAAVLQRIANPSAQSHRVSVLLGEAGIGKTRLFDEVVRAVAVSARRPYIARCRPHHASRPLSVFFELVPEWLQSPGALGVDPDSLRLLDRLIHRQAISQTDAAHADDASKGELLHRAFIDIIDCIGSEQPMLIAIEDVHYCDNASLKELSLISSHFDSLPLVCTSRSIECLKPHFGDLAEVFRLSSLEPAHMSAMARRLLGDDISEETLQWCAASASGNPLFLQMLCRHVRQTGTLGVPKDLSAMVSSRLALLGEHQLRALQYIALLASHSTLGSLEKLCGLAPHQFVDCIGQLEDQGYLAIRDNRIVLQHDLVSDACLELSPPVTKRVLHRQVAAILEESFDAFGSMATLWDCAEHWRLSGESSRSIAVLRRCATHATDLGQSSRALEALTQASQLAEDPAELAALLYDMILAAKAAGQLEDVVTFYERLTRITQITHSDAEIIAFEAKWQLDHALDIEALLSCVNCATVDVDHRFEASLLLQRFAHESCDEALAHRVFEAIRRDFTDANPYDRLLVEIVHHQTFGDREAGERAIEELATLAPNMRNVGDQMRAARNVVLGLLIAGRLTDAIAFADAFRLRARTIGLASRQFEFTSLIVACCIAARDFADAERWLSALEAAPQGRWLRMLHCSQILEIALWRKDETAAQKCLDQLKGSNYGDTVRALGYLMGAELRVRQLDADFRCSESDFASYMEVFKKVKRFVTDDDFAWALAEDLRRRGEPVLGLRLLDEYVQNARRQRWPLPDCFAELRAHLVTASDAFAAA